MKYILYIILIFMLSGCTGDRSARTPDDGQGARLRTETELPLDEATPAEVVIGQASTPLLDDSASRVENINIACGSIDGLSIYPGGSFSFNDTVGRRTEANGYGDAPVLVNGHKEEGCGGGVCQVSSTLYMAALDAGLQIDERHSHSESVAYAPKGMDATVVFGEKDLVFTNSTDKVITLSVWTDGSDVFSSITQKSS